VPEPTAKLQKRLKAIEKSKGRHGPVKKNEHIEKALGMIVELKTKFGLSYNCIARQMGLSYAKLRRWKQRVSAGKAALERPGPKKIAPLDLAQLKKRIRGLDHGVKRTRGTGRLHGAFTDVISRRDLNRLIDQSRRETNRQRAAKTCRILEQTIGGTETQAAYPYFSFLLGAQITARAHCGAKAFRRSTEMFVSCFTK
jgi:hypothetical protein